MVLTKLKMRGLMKDIINKLFNRKSDKKSNNYDIIFDDENRIQCDGCKKFQEAVLTLGVNSGPALCSMCIDVLSQTADKLSELPNTPFSLIDETQELVEFDSSSDLLHPNQIKDHLDQYIIGQDSAKKTLSIALYKHMLRFNGDINLKKSNVLLIGSTGCGKTLMVETLSKIAKIPMVTCDATTFTKVGYVGSNASDVIFDLYMKSGKNKEATERGIVYIDEIDKIAKRTSGDGRLDISGESVQHDLLKIIDGTSVDLRHRMLNVSIDTSNILFIFSGAFDGLDNIVKGRNSKSKTMGFVDTRKEVIVNNTITNEDLLAYGFLPEFMGRIHNISMVSKLDEEALVQILTEPKDSIIDQYKNLANYHGLELVFQEDSLRTIAKKALERGTGARALKGIVDNILLDTVFDMPNMDDTKELVINSELNVIKILK